MNKLAAWAGKVSGSRYPTSGRGKRSGGTTFSSKEALATYSRAHPKADMSKHTVAASAPKAAAPAAASIAKGSQGQVHVDAVRRDLAAGVHPNTVMQRHVGNVPGPQIQAEARAHQARQAAAANRPAPAAAAPAAKLSPVEASRAATAAAEHAGQVADSSSDYRKHATAADAHMKAAAAATAAGRHDSAYWHQEQAETHNDSWKEMHPSRQ